MSLYASICDAIVSEGLKTEAKALSTIETIHIHGKELKLPRPIKVKDWDIHAVSMDNIIEALIRAWQVDAIKVNYYEALRDEDWSSSDI